MFITCDSRAEMGYIYLQQPKANNPIWNESNDNNIEEYLNGRVSEISNIISDVEMLKRLNTLSISGETYLEDLEKEIFEEEYLNDKKNDYISGIELHLTRKQFISNIQNKVYRIYKLEWLEKEFLFLTLDSLDNSFEPNNIIYPANKNNDVFYVVAIEDEVCYIKAILSSRSDVYDLEYLKTTRFILHEQDAAKEYLEKCKK
jgi:hypothetical protein